MNKKVSWVMVLFAVCQLITISPNIIDFLPPELKPWVQGISGMVAGVFGMLGFLLPAVTAKPKGIDEV